MTTNQARTRALRESALPVQRSGAADAPSSGGAVVRPGAAPRFVPDDWGADELWGEPAPTAVVVEDAQEWTARPSAGAYLLFAGFLLLAVFTIGFRLGEFYAAGRLW